MKINLKTNSDGTKTVTAGDWQATVYPPESDAILKFSYSMADDRTIADFVWLGADPPPIPDDDFIDFWAQVERAIVAIESV